MFWFSGEIGDEDTFDLVEFSTPTFREMKARLDEIYDTEVHFVDGRDTYLSVGDSDSICAVDAHRSDKVEWDNTKQGIVGLVTVRYEKFYPVSQKNSRLWSDKSAHIWKDPSGKYRWVIVGESLDDSEGVSDTLKEARKGLRCCIAATLI